VYYNIEAGVSEEKKEKLVRMAQKNSPIFNSISESIPVLFHLNKD